MAEVRLTPRAKQDIHSIWRDIAADNPAAADRLILRFFDKLDLAGRNPGMGAPRPELSPLSRILVEGNYLVIYEPYSDAVVVIAVVHGARDLTDIL